MKHFRDFGIDLPDHFSGDRKVLCPQCSATRKKKNDPCLSVNGEKGIWHCHNCGWDGTLKEHSDAPRKEYRRPAPEIVTENIAPEVIAYFHGRGIGVRTLQTAKIYSCQKWLPGLGHEALCSCFPYYRDGVLLNVKYRDGRKNMAQEKDPEPCLWNYDNAKDQSFLCITEGEIDALSLMECGIIGAVSVDKGAPQPKDRDASKKLECVQNCIELLKNADCVVICSDKDEPGLRLEREILSILGPEKCKIAYYPEDCKDLNEVLCKHGKTEVLKAIDTARPAPVPGIHLFSDFSNEILELYTHGETRGLTTGWPEFDEVYTLQPGSMNVITGIPESGKTEFVHALIVNTINIHNWKWGIYSPEMMPPKALFSNFAEKFIGKSFFGKPEQRMQKHELECAIRALNASIFPVVPDENVICNLEGILDMFRVLIARDGIKGCLIDPWNELENQTPQGMSATEYTGLMLQKVVRFARHHGVWFGIVAHPTKLKKDEKGQYPVATLYDVNGSANFYNKADSGISLWRDRTIANNNVVEAHVLKVKNKYIGRSGTAQDFRWDRTSGRFTAIMER